MLRSLNLCLIFDVDDTLVEYVDFSPREWFELVARPAAEKLGISLNFAEWLEIIGGGKSRRFPEKYGVSPKLFWREFDNLNLRYRKMMFESGRLKAYPDAKYIEKLPGIKIAWSVSSRECVEFVLRSTGLIKFFDAIYGKDYADYRYLDDPKHGLLEEIVKIHRCDECIVVSDSLRDVEIAKSVGCRAIRIDRGGGGDISSIDELERIL